eukprot:TRINITY_DN7357_c0_g1_i1.p1 TRINITY_DN7357_c0_g1~~TRINITY_DN7357_c0_g1_i1.p1  ORF type:complete len:735 (+),score=215.11 TRINITY_DN7357_c0_g1_i1:84-2288(+)
MGTAFEEYAINPELGKAVLDLGWTYPRDIQAECIPAILGGGDVCASAETGSGKTGAFALPLVQVIYEALRDMEDPAKRRSEPVKMNVEDRDGLVAVSEDGLTAQARTTNWVGIRSNVGVSKGKYYYEMTLNDEGKCRFGWATKAAKLELGRDEFGFGYGLTGMKSNSNNFVKYGESFGKGDTIGSYLNCENGEISFSKNGTVFPVAFTIPDKYWRFAFYPAFCCCNAEATFNFGAKPFKYPPEGGYVGLESADRSELTQAAQADDSGGRIPLAIILEPTRDLAQQTHDAIGNFMKYLPKPKISMALLVGGLPADKQEKALKNGVDIVVATPGRAIDLLKSGILDLSNIRFFVLDEADAVIENELQSVTKLFSVIPKSKSLQVLFFSATLQSPEVKKLANEICRFPTWIDLKGQNSVPETVDHAFVWANPKEDKSYLEGQPKIKTDGMHAKDKVNIQNLPNEESVSEAIKLLKPQLLMKIINSFKMDQAIIFCRTRIDCDNLEVFMKSITGKKGPMIDTEYSCAVLHAGVPQKERTNVLKKFKAAEVRFLIASDAIARGIDVNELPFVINYTLPDTPESYIHRIGRVGRADRMGLAISIVGAFPEKVWFHKCPSRGENCHNTNLTDKGGCAVWYDEPTYFKQICDRVQTEIPVLDKEFKLSAQSKSGVVYGQRKEGGEDALFKGHAEQLKPLVTELNDLELLAQKSYWNMKLKFSNQSKTNTAQHSSKDVPAGKK